MKIIPVAAILVLSLGACVANPPRETAVRETTTSTTRKEILVDDNNDGYYDRSVPASSGVTVARTPDVVIEEHGYNEEGDAVIVRKNVGTKVYYDESYPVLVRDMYPPYKTKYVYTNDGYDHARYIRTR